MKNLWILILLTVVACTKQTFDDTLLLENYIKKSDTVLYDKIIACAAGNPNGISGEDKFETSIFFYPVSGATDYKYFEAVLLKDSLNFDKYIQSKLVSEPVFNGYLRKFNRGSFSSERMGIVTYYVGDELHICTPIRLKTNVKPTEVNPKLLAITENGITPSFIWSDGKIDENVIYFQVISDLSGHFISGTYTYEKQFTFYNLDNVVLNVTDPNTTPQLEHNSIYNFTMMAVSEDNWVNLMFQVPFQTN